LHKFVFPDYFVVHHLKHSFLNEIYLHIAIGYSETLFTEHFSRMSFVRA